MNMNYLLENNKCLIHLAQSVYNYFGIVAILNSGHPESGRWDFGHYDSGIWNSRLRLGF